MWDSLDLSFNALHAYGDPSPSPSSSRSTTPLPGSGSRTLQRTISCASIDTVRPSSSKGVRRRISEITENLKHKSAKTKKKPSSTHDAPEAAHDSSSDPKASSANKTTKKEHASGRKATVPLRDSSHQSEERNVLGIADRLHNGVPSERDSASIFLGFGSNHTVAESPSKDEQLLENGSCLTSILDLGAHVATECRNIFQFLPTSKVDIKDVQLDIRPAVSDMTIWDGLQSAHHLFKCRLFLRCTTHPYNSVSVSDISRIEMSCSTHPSGSRYARPPLLQAAYEGASPGRITNSSGLPDVNLAAGIHIDRFWCTILNGDGTWGWYKDAFIPLSPRLFDKADYRKFKLVSRVWIGESCMEDESTFGISMLLREVDMT